MKKIIKTSTALMAALCVSITISPNLLATISDAHVCEEPDHLLSYPLTLSADFVDITAVTLEDQFLGAAIGGFTIEGDDFGGGHRLLNPATKWHNGQRFRPEHPNTHYISFPVTTATLPTLVGGTFRVFNQFGSFDLNTGAAAGEILNVGLTLLVPSLKQACPEDDCPGAGNGSCPSCFPDGNHYLCYPIAVDAICPIDERVRLEDQFQKNLFFDGRLTPTRFCNPVVKTINGVSSPSDDIETNHLTCYSIGEKFLNPGRFVRLLNQFGEQRGFVESSDELCVPSVKVADLSPVAGN